MISLKKIISLLLAIAIITAAITGCAGKTDNGGSSKGETSLTEAQLLEESQRNSDLIVNGVKFLWNLCNYNKEILDTDNAIKIDGREYYPVKGYNTISEIKKELGKYFKEDMQISVGGLESVYIFHAESEGDSFVRDYIEQDGKVYAFFDTTGYYSKFLWEKGYDYEKISQTADEAVVKFTAVSDIHNGQQQDYGIYKCVIKDNKISEFKMIGYKNYTEDSALSKLLGFWVQDSKSGEAPAECFYFSSGSIDKDYVGAYWNKNQPDASTHIEYSLSGSTLNYKIYSFDTMSPEPLSDNTVSLEINGDTMKLTNGDAVYSFNRVLDFEYVQGKLIVTDLKFNVTQY
jgi:hypothetical protein